MTYSDEEMSKYNTYVAHLKEVTEERLTKIGSTNSGLDLFRVDINPEAERTICVGATMHGDEISGCLGLIKFLKNCTIPNNIHLLIFPLINPHGYVKNNRFTLNQVDLNRCFRTKYFQEEALIIKNSLEDESIDFLLSLHEDSRSDCFYSYIPESLRPENLNSLKSIIANAIPIMPTGKYRGEDVREGIITLSKKDHSPHNLKSFEYWVSTSHHCPYLCTELPSQVELATRIACVLTITEWCIGNFSEIS